MFPDIFQSVSQYRKRSLLPDVSEADLKISGKFCRSVIEGQGNFFDFSSFMGNAVDEVSQFNRKRTPDNHCRENHKTSHIYPKASMKRINKNVTEKIE
jgi:hypothetical protein